MLTVLLAALTGCDAGGLAVAVPHVSAPAELVFTDAPLGEPSFATVQITNDGAGDGVLTLAATPPFAVSGAPLTLAAGARTEILVTFVPEGYRQAHGELVVETTRQSVSIALSGDVDADVDDDGALARSAGGDDCDDREPDVRPGLPEVCDGLDNDCDGEIDDQAVDRSTWYLDLDGDGFGREVTRQACQAPPDYVDRGGDCDDDDPDVNPDAREIWYDGVDQDCDGASDHDQDLDGYDSDIVGGGDCQDRDPDVHPGAADTPYDGVDQDCDGASDYDRDGDGADAAAYGGTDCDDDDATVAPGLPEQDDGVDQDCDGMVDEDFVLRGDLVFTEIMRAPTIPEGQFVELANTSDRSVQLAGATVSVARGSTRLPALELPPTGVAVLCSDPDPDFNGGISCDALLPRALEVDDRVEIRLERVLDEVDWSGWDVTTGASWNLWSEALHPDDNDELAAWCTASVPYGDGDLGSPGLLVDCDR